MQFFAEPVDRQHATNGLKVLCRIRLLERIMSSTRGRDLATSGIRRSRKVFIKSLEAIFNRINAKSASLCS